MIKYQIPPGVIPGSELGRPVLSTPQGGKIALDESLLDLWKRAADGNLARTSRESAEIERAALACLAEAGLLERRLAHPDTPLHTSETRGELVSVVIVNYNSIRWLKDCLVSLESQTYTSLEIIVVDNGSHDGCGNWLRVHYPGVKFLQIEKSQSLSHAINCGVDLAAGTFLLVLNPDVWLEADAVQQMVRVMTTYPRTAAVSAKLKYLRAPSFLNGLGNRVGPFSWGMDNAQGHLDLGQFDHWELAPSACLAAALITKTAWQEVGPLDECFPMYYEDSEWSYRARLLGFEVRVAPLAVVYHEMGGIDPINKDALSPRKLSSVVYGRQRFAIKLVTFRTLPRFLAGYYSEDIMLLLGSIIRRDWTRAKAITSAWAAIWKDIKSLRQYRRAIQSRRVVNDKELFAFPHEIPPSISWRGLPELTWDLVRSYYAPLIRSGKTRPMPEFPKNRQRLLIISNDILGEKMAGPGMRYLEIARALACDVDVAIANPSNNVIDSQAVPIVPYHPDQPEKLKDLVDEHDLILISSFILEKFPFLEKAGARIVVDLYDPFILENLHYYKDETLHLQEQLNERGLKIMNRLVSVGDFFICGSERQRDFWIGVLAANGRVNPRTVQEDSDLRLLIDVVGIGINRSTEPNKPYLKGVHPSFPVQSRIVVWGGGIWDWLDPLTLVKAWPDLIAKIPEARLVFLGTQHPNPSVPRHKKAVETILLSEEIGEKDRTIFFFEWLPYEERWALLQEANAGVSLHPRHLETRFSIRTRVIDYFGAGLPSIVTEGDVTSELVHQFKTGLVTPAQDVRAVYEALIKILDTPKEDYSAAFDSIQEVFDWSRVVEPLRRYCLYGERAPDKGFKIKIGKENRRISGLRGLAARAKYIHKSEGTRTLFFKVWRYLQWRWSRLS
jgi:GT2 family glycosyltransferase/glycosyltransferase involved in cell wall biosynthesis